MQRKYRQFFRVALVALLLLTGCGSENGGSETETEITESVNNQVVLTAPYRAVLDAGESVNGAQLEYVGQDEQGIHVRIDGQDIVKKIGDSFNWYGNPATGVELDYQLRVMGVYLNIFQAWGNVKIIVRDPAPVRAEVPAKAPLTFENAVATFAVQKGEIIPGTTLSFLGKSEKGAEFGGLDGYPYREIADSLDWSGELRENVFVDLTLRVSSIHDDQATLVGLTTVWIFPD